MKSLRALHLYIGCLFAPALIFFIVTGCWQTFRLNDASEDAGYAPPKVVEVLSEVHVNQRLKEGVHASVGFKLFVVAMTVFLLITIIVGIVLALQVSRNRWVVWACLAGGLLVPLLLLLSG